MSGSVIKIASIIVISLCAVAVPAVFTWTGLGLHDTWDDCQNWSLEGQAVACFPSSTSDDVLLDGTSSSVNVFLVAAEEGIDDLRVKGTVTLDNGYDDECIAQLEVDSFQIIGGTGGATFTVVDSADVHLDHHP